MSLIKKFKQPGNSYRGKPFWAWNGALEPEELKRQIRVFEQMGLGGFFMHSRVGLATPYLGEDWFDCIDACLDEAGRLGQEAWLYDEDRWPSGAAGGLVTKDPKYRARYLVMRLIPAERYLPLKGQLAAWQGEVEGGAARNLTPLRKGKKPEAGKTVLAFSIEAMANDPWFNGYTYLDTLSEEAVARYIEVTHEQYKDRYKKQFGKLVPGMFTDEPNFGTYSLFAWAGARGERSAALPWTPALPEVFKDRYDYDILKHLPELFLDVDGNKVVKARYNYRDCVTALFVKAFARQIGQWCEDNGLLFTGHVLYEEPSFMQTAVVGSAMRFYEHMQAPGIDILTQHWAEYDTAKQCASVAHQMGRQWMLSELYGCTGWDFSFEGHKAVGDWQAALGVNMRCQHLSWYTMAGEAKRDYPASISFQSPWWPYYRVVEDYFARVGVLTTEGEPVRRLLVINPLESMWLRYRPPLNEAGQAPLLPDSDEIQQLYQRMIDLRGWLLGEHIDYDFADEEMFDRLGAVKKNGGQPRIKVGQADYDAVLVPPLLTMRGSTLKLLRKFQAAGGKVIFAGEGAPAIDAEPVDDPATVIGKCDVVAFEKAAVAGAVEGARRVSIKDAAGAEIANVLYQLRETNKRQILFLCNTGRQTGYEQVAVAIKTGGHVSEWDATTSERFATPAVDEDGWVRFETSLPAAGSRLFTIEAEVKEELPARPRFSGERREALQPEPAVQLTEPNILVLDRPRFRLGEGELQEAREILKVDQAVREALGVPWRGGAMVQPWARKTPKHEPTLALELRHTIQVEELPNGPLYLAMEKPERFTIKLNGFELKHEPSDGWWVDPCLCRLPVDPATLVQGANELVLTSQFKETDNLEAMFLLGDFGVKLEGTEPRLTTPVRALALGDWAAQGLPFYGSAVTYRARVNLTAQAGERVYLAAPDFKGAVVRVLVNGQEAGFLAWAPYELDLTAWAGQGEVAVALQVFGSRRNCFGPLHITQPEPQWIGPGEFLTGGPTWQEEYSLKPVGLMAAPSLVYRRVE